MKNILCTIVLVLFASNMAQAVNYYSTANGGWNQAVWSTRGFNFTTSLIGLPCEKNGSDSIFINRTIGSGTCGEININKNGGSNVLVIKSGATFEMSSLSTGGSFRLYIERGATVMVHGALKMKGSSEIFVEGTFHVEGNVEMGGSSRVCGNGLAWHDGTRTNSGSSMWCASLPIKLTSFEGKWNSQKNEIALTWVTQSEENNAYFTVERSVDGINFDDIAEVMGAGTSNEARYYEFTDNNPSLYSQWSYYRLKQTDLDGTFTYSPIISLENTRDLNGGNTVQVFPNPAVDNFTVQFADASENSDVWVLNALGQLQATQKVNKGSNSINFETNNWTAGVYVVIVNQGVVRQQQKIVVR